MNDELINSAQMLAARYLAGNKIEKSLAHSQRVAQLAVKLYQQDHYSIITAQKEALLVMGYLHDVVDNRMTKKTRQRLQIITEVLRLHQVDEIEITEILNTIVHMSYTKNLQQHYELSLLGQYVQDSDALDALGAIGIGRAFAYGGKKNLALYDHNLKPTMTTLNDRHHHAATTLNLFYEKLLNLPQQMNTNAGKILAQRRRDYMQQFLDEFVNEWYSMY